MKLTQKESLTAKKRTINLGKKCNNVLVCKVDNTTQLNESINLDGVIEHITPHSNNAFVQAVSHTSIVPSSTDSTVLWPPAGILRQALMSFTSLGPGEKLPSSNTNDQESSLPKISSSLLNTVDDIKLVISSTASISSSSESVPAKAIPLGPLCTGTFFTESLPLNALSSGTLPFVSLGLPFGSFIQGPLLPNGALGLPLISVSASNLSPLSETSSSVVSTASLQKSTPLLINSSANISCPNSYLSIPSLDVPPVKVLLPDSTVMTSDHQIVTSQFSQTQTSVLSKEEIVKVVCSSIPKMDPCSSHFTQGIHKAMPLPPMSEVKSSLTSHLNVLTQTRNDDKPSKVCNDLKLNNNSIVTSMQAVEREEHGPSVQFNNISLSTSSDNVGPIKLDSTPDISSDLSHATTISIPTGAIPIKLLNENSSSSDMNSSIVIPVSNDMILTKVNAHLTSQDISHIVTIPLPMGTVYSNSLSIPMHLSVSGEGNSIPSSSVQLTSSTVPNLSSCVSGISNMTSSSIWSCSNSVSSVTSETIQPPSSRATPLFTEVPVTSLSTSNMITFTSNAISIPSSLSTTTNTVSATSSRSCVLQDPAVYTIQSPAEILSQLSKAGVLPAMSSSQVSSVLSALGSESHLDMESDVIQHGEISNQVLQVDKVSTLTQTDDLELDEKAESSCGTLDDSLMAQQVMHMLAQPGSESHSSGVNNQKTTVVPNDISQNGVGPTTYPGIVAMVLNHDTKVVLPLPDVSVPGKGLREALEKSSDTKLGERLLDLPQAVSAVELSALGNNLENVLRPGKLSPIQKQPRRISSLREMLLGSADVSMKHTASKLHSTSVFVKQETGYLTNKKTKKSQGKPKKLKCESINSNDSTKKKCNKNVKRFIDHLEEDSGESTSSIMEEVSCLNCKFCPFLSLERNSMTLHIQQKHSRKVTEICVTRQKLKCPGCSNVFFTTNSLEVHLRQDHQVVEPELKTIIESAVKVSEKNQMKQKQLESKSRREHNDVMNKSELGKEKIISVTNLNCNIPGIVVDEDNKIRVRNLNSKMGGTNLKKIAAKEESNVRYGNNEFYNKEVIDIDPLVQQKCMSTDMFTYRVIKADDIALMVLNDLHDEKKKETTVRVRKRGRPKGSKNECMLVGSTNNGEHSQDYRCNINNCAVLLRSHDNIEYHRRCHDGSVYRCPECAHSHGHWSGMSIHLWRCHVIDMELYTCDQCNYKTNSYARLVNLHKVIHGTERPFLCDSCGKGFKNRKQLRNHKAIHVAHSKPKQPKVGECEVCGRGFTNKRMLRMHLDNVHNKLRPHLCNYCGYSASSVSGLKMHMRKHTGEKPFHCNQCDYCTSDHNSLRRHKMRHTGDKPYKCPHCPYACIQSSTYKAHLKTKHPGMDDGLMFSCDICSFRSVREDNYFTHMSEHKTSKNPHSWTRKSDPKQNGEAETFNLDMPSESVVHLVEHLGDKNNDNTNSIGFMRSVEPVVITVTPDYEAEEITGDIHEPKEPKFVVRKEEGQ